MKSLPFFCFALLAGYAQAADSPSRDYGMPVSSEASGRNIEIKASTRHVNVYDGETIHFLIDGKKFDWHFNTRTREAVLDLKTIAPPSLQAGDVRVWVMPNPLYQG